MKNEHIQKELRRIGVRFERDRKYSPEDCAGDISRTVEPLGGLTGMTARMYKTVALQAGGDLYVLPVMVREMRPGLPKKERRAYALVERLQDDVGRHPANARVDLGVKYRMAS
ncbi:hypothetical protein GF342_00660 [Candidatus Woesearchaeota archaeon]|nr:hypothetical protein [Candidatus Woesearchaeota archaeon]